MSKCQRGLRLIGEEKLAAPTGDFVELTAVNQRSEVRHVFMVGENVEPLGRGPQGHKLSVIEEHAGASRAVRTVLEIVDPAVEQQCGLAGVEKDGRKRVVRSIQN